MADSSLTDQLAGPAAGIGRYFSALSVISSTLLASWLVVLYATGAWSHDPNWSAGFQALGSGGLTRIVQLGLFGLLIGLLLHPLQFAFVQFCEGYWGGGPVGHLFMADRMRRHLMKVNRLETARIETRRELRQLGQDPTDPDADAVSLSTVKLLVAFDEAERALLSYPHNPNDIRPTRLGNALRRYETASGAPYGLGLVTVAPHLGLVAKPNHVEYLDDQRTQLDLAIRLVIVSILAMVASVAFLWRDGLSVLVALAPYTLAYIFYRGSIIVAGEYGTALATVLDLNRFALYDALHIRWPSTSAEERAVGPAITTALRVDEYPDDRRSVDFEFISADHSRPSEASEPEGHESEDPGGTDGDDPDGDDPDASEPDEDNASGDISGGAREEGEC
jgi:hypothetical protein